MKKNILVLNNISETGLVQLSDYNLETESESPDAILLRSQNLHQFPFSANLLAVGRAGAGVNNIPVEQLSEMGVVVFNTPGANANAVKELVLSAMLISARNLFSANDFVKTLTGTDQQIDQATEANKKNFAGIEIAGKTLGIVGLGAIGVMLANTAIELGMNVVGYDPAITIQNAWRLSAHVKRASSLGQLYTESDFISFHVPLIPATKGLFGMEQISQIKAGVTILNFSRAGIVDPQAILSGIKEQKIKYYCCDFPEVALQNQANVITFPHLGASTAEAEENCAKMVCKQIKFYLETGNITNSVNLPEVELPPIASGSRLVIINRNVPNIIAEITGKLGSLGINILDMINKSKGEYACTIVDTDSVIDQSLVQDLSAVAGILKVRVI